MIADEIHVTPVTLHKRLEQKLTVIGHRKAFDTE